MVITNESKNTAIADRAGLAKSLFARMKGLVGKERLTAGEGLVIPSCQAIHMVFMRFAIDAIFVDSKKKVVGLVKNIQPFKVSPVFFRASFVIEVPAGTILSSQTQLGDTISIKS